MTKTIHMFKVWFTLNDILDENDEHDQNYQSTYLIQTFKVIRAHELFKPRFACSVDIYISRIASAAFSIQLQFFVLVEILINLVRLVVGPSFFFNVEFDVFL